MSTVRLSALYVLRALGVFALAKYLTRKRLRILCYHSFSVGDEHEVDPVMFMRAQTFEQRMRTLKKRGIPVVTLDEAVRKLRERAIGNAETVITLDDGWASNLTIGAPILEKYGFPACIYTSTEHFEAGTEVFNVALSYMVRRSGHPSLTLAGVHPLVDGNYAIGTNPASAIIALIRAAERLPVAARQELLRPIARALGADLDEVLREGRFRLLSRSEMQQAFHRGLDIQMHTHTHHLPDNEFDAMAQEINVNRRMIREVTGVDPQHFCYPSGEYREQHPAWLKSLGIASATTCNPGLNDASTSPLLLNRMLDSDRRSNIDFEAEICGVSELARRLPRRKSAKTDGISAERSLSGSGPR